MSPSLQAEAEDFEVEELDGRDPPVESDSSVVIGKSGAMTR